jgi:disulfide bond formation protein DsbB
MHMEDLSTLITTSNYWFALITLIGFIVLVIWALELAALKLGFLKLTRPYYRLLARYALPLGFFLTLFATIGSLYYQYYLHLPPCDLCWYQRAFIYPLLFVFAYAWYKNDKNIYNYIMGLSVVGGLIALYHHYLQMGYDLYQPCSTAPFAVDCSTPTFIEFGFVTYPFMALVTLGFTFLLAYTAKRFAI